VPVDWNNIVVPPLVKPGPGQAMHNSWSDNKAPVSFSSEMRRVLGLPRRDLELDGTDRAETIIDMMMERFARPVIPGRKCRCAELDPERHAKEGCIERLRLPQAQSLREIGICGGLLGPIGVGHGKTLIDLLAPLAWRYYDRSINDVVLLVPAGLASQLMGDYEYYGQHFKMPQIVFHGIDYENTCQKMDPKVPLERGAPCLHVVKYTMLSRPENTVWLENVLKPQAIISDEAHKLRYCCPEGKKRPSATGSRMWRYMQYVAPGTLCAALSGSMTAKEIEDYWHLAMWALRGSSPLPRNIEIVQEWGRAINPSLDPADPGPLMQLCAPGEHLYDGFKRRVAETCGVVTTAAPAVDVPLTLVERQAPPIPTQVKQYLAMVRGGGEAGSQRPDGEELLTSLEIAECAMQISFGFYYRWIYPRCIFPRDEQLVTDWKALRKAFFKEVRAELRELREHMDSPKLVISAAARHHGLLPKKKGLPEWASKHFPAWNKIKALVYAKTEAVCFNDYIVRDIIAWSQEQPGVIWYEHNAIGDWVSQLSSDMGCYVPKYGGGPAAKEAMLGNQKKSIPGENGSRSILCSVDAHGTGTNGLQHRFKDSFLLHITPDPNKVEQVLGRTHRPGQIHPCRGFFYRHTPELKKHLDDALAAAYYIEGTGFGTQKLLRAWAE
jgi:hypothetical protein